ncbi:MAG: GntR family transcriptional regulator [Clostridia bacterium]|nr:GntR family transcriptional regulator [Clostridia bacterium]
MAWQFDNHQPIWVQISDRLLREIISGKYEAGARFPAVRELAAEAAVNPNTMQRALANLEQQGVLIGNRTAGRTVTADLALLQNFREQMAEADTKAYLADMAVLGYTVKEAAEWASRIAGEATK